MATNSPAGKGALPDNARRILEVLEFVNGTIEFDKYTAGHSPPNAEAARKRIRRAFEAYGVNVTIRGNTIVGARSSANPTIPQLFKRTPKRKTTDLDEDKTAEPDTPETPTHKKPKTTTQNAKVEKKEESEDEATEE